MEPAADEIAIESPAHFRLYKSGRIERLNRPPVLPAGLDEATGVTSKDVVLDPETGLSCAPSKKLPVLVFFHGGGFMLESAGSATYHTYVNPLAAAAGVLVVSVCYRLAPEHPLPAAYEDSWAALQWAASARDEWIAEHGDVARLFLAGANIVHDMLLRASGNGGPSIEGAIMLHPWFGGSTLIEGESEVAAAITAGLWVYACPDAVGGVDDPRMNVTRWRPARRRWRSSGRGRERVAWHESDGEEHVLFLPKPECENARQLMDRVVAFIAGA
ncbi:LOW QUALITY PROTEIN: hypothetical protein SETIT_4G044100v2 [Setaria italica]|uniref:Alpha/beta hydrolase fold-3 domain-containing protein n=1 Tax=Setaria italica TaxID=4555 RepID=A0A368QQP2_SETIT|nr:LOW QUALITY PROTEIN: hypothetical protein SETIT_4G044100v2 [Setaria italica]